MTCGSGNTYIRGKGCAVTQATYGDTTYRTVLPVLPVLPALSGSNSNQSCVQPEAAKAESVSQCKVIYDSNVNITQKQVTSASDSRVWSYSYGTFGKLLTMTEPNGATTAYSYYPDNHSIANLRGLLQTVTNGAGHTITINSYNYQGLPSNISMLNGLSKSMTYDLRGRVLTETSVDGTNTYVYDLAGSLVQVSFSNSYILNMSYDMDHRMTGMTDNRGNSLVYTLDSNGNPINESEYTESTLVSVKNKVFDGLSRMTQTSRASNAYPYNYTYDKLDRVTNVQNPNNQSQAITYDNKDNVTAMSELGRNQNMTRDDDGNMTGINQQGNSHSYTYNGLGEMLSMTNIDTGSHSYTYNIPNKTTTHTDNAGITHTNTYDNLGRLLLDSTSTTSHNYTWDSIKAGKLSSISDNSGSTSYGYNSNARLTSKTQAIGTYSKSVGYSYDSSGQLNQITYPSGLQTIYQYSNGVVSGIQVGSTSILSSIGYKGFNSTPVSWTWGNSTSRILGIDANQRLTGLADGSVMNQGISQDNLNNVTAVSDSANTNNSFTASYSASEQLTSFNQSSVNRVYGQDGRFNLQSIAPIDTNYTQVYFGFNFPSNTIYNLGFSGSPYMERYIGKDVKGNMTSDGTGATFVYDDKNNMVSANKINPATYAYNALSQRVSKTVTSNNASTTTYYVYNEAGLLIGEYDSSGVAIAEHIYLNNIPVAVVKSGTIYYVHTDHLGTPRAITNTSGTVVWKWDNTNAYGYNPANETVSGSLFDYNIRFSGQYFDKESGLHYNYHRMYNPELGRYMQPDPIGVAGGMNLYSYVENNPLNATDPYGLMPSLPQGLVDFAAGYGDSASFGLTNVLRNNVSFLGEANTKSNYYIAGEVTDICTGVVSFGVSNILKSSIRKLSSDQKAIISRLARNTPAYNNIKSPGITPHHINPLFGHYGGKESFFPTGTLGLTINSSQYNLKGLSHAEHVQAHRNLFNLEQGYSSYQSTIVLRGQNDYLRK